MNDRISIHPRICHGQACIRGTRIPVHPIVRMFAHGDSSDTLLGAYSAITREDVLACLDDAAPLAEPERLKTPIGFREELDGGGKKFHSSLNPMESD